MFLQQMQQCWPCRAHSRTEQWCHFPHYNQSIGQGKETLICSWAPKHYFFVAQRTTISKWTLLSFSIPKRFSTLFRCLAFMRAIDKSRGSRSETHFFDVRNLASASRVIQFLSVECLAFPRVMDQPGRSGLQKDIFAVDRQISTYVLHSYLASAGSLLPSTHVLRSFLSQTTRKCLRAHTHICSAPFCRRFRWFVQATHQREGYTPERMV